MKIKTLIIVLLQFFMSYAQKIKIILLLQEK